MLTLLSIQKHSFNVIEHKVNDYKAVQLQKLNDIFEDSLYNSKSVIVISNVSIKNNITISITHVHSDQNIVAKIIHYTVMLLQLRLNCLQSDAESIK